MRNTALATLTALLAGCHLVAGYAPVPRDTGAFVSDATVVDAAIQVDATRQVDAARQVDAFSGVDGLNYDLLVPDQQGTGDAGAAAAIISATPLVTVPDSAFAFVDLEVDWTRQLAYVSTRESDQCVRVVDFANPAEPTVVSRLAPGTHTHGGTCVGIAMFDGGRKLALTSQYQGWLEIWDLGLDPRSGQFTRLADHAMGGYPHRLAVREGSPDVLYVARGNAGRDIRRFEFDPDHGTLVESASYPAGCPSNHVTIVGDNVATGCQTSNSPVLFLDGRTLMRRQIFVELTWPDGSGLWCGATSADGLRVFQGGWVSAFIHADGTLGHRFDNPATYRDAVFVEDRGRHLLYGVLSNAHYLDVWDATDVGAPKLLSHALIPGVSKELYGIEVDPQSRRAIVVSNDGYFRVIDIDQLPPTSHAYLTF